MNKLMDRLISGLWIVMILVFCIEVQRFIWRTADYLSGYFK